MELVPLAKNTVTISVIEYEGLKRDSNWLAALEAAGVDNWEGYDVAIQISNGEDPW